MKLNPTKCTSGVQEGKFLGYYIMSKGIQPSQEKVKELPDIAEPRSLKDMQELKRKSQHYNDS